MGGMRMTQVTALILHAIGVGHGLASGTVYPALRRLEEARLLRGEWEEAPETGRRGRPQRRFYELTDAGQVALQSVAERLSNARAFLVASPPVTEG